jgi:nitroimidazol reductase NimA-like FMN-containing flavoprotein (pyridoxamine 5'-phosphate oxidase superfamily)
MRRNDKEITDYRIIEEILSKSVICRIAIMDQEAPYIVPLNYGYFNNQLFFHAAAQGRKIDLLKVNNKVCFEIDYAHEIIKTELSCNWTAKYRSVIGYGIIEMTNDIDQIKNGLNIIMSHYGRSENTYDEKYLQRIVLLKLKIESISGKQSGDWEE